MSGEAWGTAEEEVLGRQTAEEEEGRKLGELIQSVFVRFFPPPYFFLLSIFIEEREMCV